MVLANVSLDNTHQLSVRIGDSGGVETSGYAGGTSVVYGTNTCATAASSATHCDISQTSQGASTVYTGRVVFELVNPAGNYWTVTSLLTSGLYTYSSTGFKSLSAALDRVQLTTNAGTANFDSGYATILYE
jgi:hypothetical protein